MTSPAEAAMRVRSLSVVIPVHNEEGILGETVKRITSGLGQLGLEAWEVILCENGSTDRTREVAEELARTQPGVRTLVSAAPDYGAAMRAGFQAAAGDAVVNFDADYYDLDFVRRALAADAHIVVAGKGVPGAEDTRRLSRRLVSRGFSWLVRRVLRVRVAETHGMKVFRREAIAPILPLVRATKDLFDTELLVRAERAGLRIAILPVRTVELRRSRTAILSRVPRTLWGLLRIRARLRREGRFR
ncbi:MAG TPA: glycosyltransferase family 2 protein [Actinomycetota bacterium]|nr:glycosyltransferase family 2 protein [Actinomycetota bacterium]